MNLVGTAIIDCTRAPAWRRTECFTDGNVQYTLRQEGTVALENHDREMLFFSMEPGVIESARALSAERYLTNPLSSVDERLIAPYEASEMWGRPLGSTYSLRMFGHEAVVWPNLDDIQILLTYDYWTRQE